MGRGEHGTGRCGSPGPVPVQQQLLPASASQATLDYEGKLNKDEEHGLTKVTRLHLLVVIALLILIIVALAVSLAVIGSQGSAAEDLKLAEVLPPCGDDWILYRNKCFYFSEAEGNWTEAKDSCAALNSSLAMFDTPKELDFMRRYKGDRDHWIGLWKDSNMQWKWINGTEFNNWFTVKDYSDYAYLNHHHIKSGESHNTRSWICTKEPTYERKRKD